MWFKLNTTFTTSLGKLSELTNSWPITRYLTNFTTASNVLNVEKNGAYEAVFTIGANCTVDTTPTVTMSGIAVSASQAVWNASAGTLTVKISSVTGPVVITASATRNSSSGGSGESGEPETPVNPPSGDSTTLSPISVRTGFFLDGHSQFQGSSTSSVVVYSVQPNSTYTLSVEKKSSAATSNANLIFAPVKSLSGLQVGGTPDFATGYSERVVELSTNETNVLNYQFTTPADCTYLVLSNYQSGSTHTVVGIPGDGYSGDIPEPEGTDVALTKAVDGVYLARGAGYTAEASSQVLCYAVSPNKTYVIGTPLDPTKQLVVCCVKSIDNIAAGNAATLATGWSDRQVADANTNLTITTPADCTHLVFSNYLKNQAPSYVKLID